MLNWLNKNKNQRVSNEDNASWYELIIDDLSQLTHTDLAFSNNSTTLFTIRPFKAFTPKMVATGPTPLIRQLILRPLRMIT
jgi:hypothetical protein